MKSIKYYSLICFFILCVPFNISATENDNVLVEAKDELKFESVIERTKKSVVILSMNPNVDPETDPKQTGLCSGVVVDDIGNTEFFPISNYVSSSAKRKINRKWQRFEASLNELGLSLN